MARFSIRVVMIAIAIAAFFLTAFLSPHQIWASVVLTVFVLTLLGGIAVAIGSKGQLRAVVLAYVIVGASWMLISRFDQTLLGGPLATHFLLVELDSVAKTSKQQTTPANERVIIDGNVVHISLPDGSGRRMTLDGAESSGILSFGSSIETAVSFYNFELIGDTLFAFLTGLLAAFITGYLRTRRNSPASAES